MTIAKHLLTVPMCKKAQDNCPPKEVTLFRSKYYFECFQEILYFLGTKSNEPSYFTLLRFIYENLSIVVADVNEL